MSDGMNVVFIVPTGIGAEIGGHAGDATPAARLIASACDTLILHPNVVNASDINEMPLNSLYVEGSILDRFLNGTVGLIKPKANRVLVAVNNPVSNEIVNMVSGARAVLGLDAFIVELETPFLMNACFDSNGKASGDVSGVRELVVQLSSYSFDALALITPVNAASDIVLEYAKHGGVNPWGGVEALASSMIAQRLNLPVAHAPFPQTSALESYSEKVAPEMASEFVSITYSFCILKGLHRAPRLVNPDNTRALNVGMVDALVSPFGCWGAPHVACMDRGIPIIVVRENKTIYDKVICNPLVHYVTDYETAVGRLMAIREGLSIDSLHRPMNQTAIKYV